VSELGPLPHFDPELHVSPFRLFRRLHEAQAGRARTPRLLDLREQPGPLRLRAATPWQEQMPVPEGEAVLVDNDGRRATDLARRLREEGHARVQALYGGLRLYDFALDPGVVGEERFLA